MLKVRVHFDFSTFLPHCHALKNNYMRHSVQASHFVDKHPQQKAENPGICDRVLDCSPSLGPNDHHGKDLRIEKQTS